MPRVVIITDSTASLPAPMYDEYQIAKVPYYVHIEDRTLRDTVDVTTSEFCEYLAGLPDGAIANTPEQRLAVARFIRELRPRVLLAPMERAAVT